jgi:hypothetical protein
MICYDYESPIRDNVSDRYHQTPILKYIDLIDFTNYLRMMKVIDQQQVFWAIGKRYKVASHNQKLFEEIGWLKSLKEVMLEEARRKDGKPSGYRLKILVEEDLDEAIKILEDEKALNQVDATSEEGSY